MAISYYWRPVTSARNDIETWAPSEFRDSLIRAFDKEFPMKLSREDLPVLLGMACVTPVVGEKPGAYKTLINAIKQVGEIEIWGES